MGWIYLAASEGYHSHLNNGSGQSPIVKTTDTLKPYFCPACKAVNYFGPQSVMTCEPCQERVSEDQSILFTEASPARTSALLEMEKAWAASAQDFTSNSKELSRKQNQLSCFLKTSLQSGRADLRVLSGDFPSSGMISDGQLFQPEKLEPVTFAKDGSDLPTPMAQNYGSNRGGGNGRVGKWRHSLASMAKRNVIPTPMARDWKGSGGANRQSPDLPRTMNGNLNPQFVEEIMGYPTGWTVCADWAIASCRAKRRKRSSVL